MENEIRSDRELDARRLSCPLPVLRTGRAIAALSAGQVLKVATTDPGSKNDLAAWARWTGNELLSVHEERGAFVFFIRKQTKE
jgi:tRNA 2-thiouridine synthesizing protein A